VRYTNGFKARMIQRMVGTERISATALEKEVGVSQATLSRWLRGARGIDEDGGPGVLREGSSMKRARKWTSEDKLRVVMEAMRLGDDELGALLRKEGLHEAELKEWTQTAIQGAQLALSPTAGKKAKPSAERRQIQDLERDLRRKEKALAEVVALLALKKKVQELWGDGDGDTHTRSGT